MKVTNMNSQAQLANNGSESAQQERRKNNKPVTQRFHYEWKRKQQPILFYFLCIFCYAYTSLEISIVMYLGLKFQKGPDELIIRDVISCSIRIVILLVNSYYMGQIKGILFSYTMCDGLGILTLCNAAMFIAIQLTFSIPLNKATSGWQIAYDILVIFNYLCLTGNFRLMMKTCIWNNVKVLFFKTILYFCCLFCISYGIYYSINKVSDRSFCTQCIVGPSCHSSCKSVTDCCYDSQNAIKKGLQTVSEFIVMLTGTSLAYNSQLISFLSDHDGTGDMELHYTLGIPQQETKQESEQQIEGLNNQRQRQIFEDTILQNTNQ